MSSDSSVGAARASAGRRAPALAARRGAQPAGPTVLDTFAGIGGSSLGARLAGFRVVLASDGCPSACAAYTANAPSHGVLCADAADAPVFLAALRARCKDIGVSDHFDCILCSLPCQGFSSASSSRHKDTRRGLGARFLPVLIDLAPTAIVFENVVPFAVSAEWAALRLALSASYDVSEHVICASHLGVPQRRRRFFGVCIPSGAEDRLSAAVAELAAVPETTMAQTFPGMVSFFHLPRGRTDPAVFSAARPAPTVRTTCAAVPNYGTYRRRLRDAGPLRDATVLSVADWARVQGFPSSWILPTATTACGCPFCASSRRRPAPRMIGNAVCPGVMAFVLSHIRHVFAPATGGGHR